jgi:hypothetical protein
MRAGNARTSVKPGRRRETRSVGYAVRPRRLPPTLPPPNPRWRCWLGTNSAISRPRRYGLREQSGHGAGAAPPGAKQPRSGRRIRPAPDLPAWSDAHLAGEVTHPARHACREERVRPGPSPLSCRPSDSLVARSATAATGRLWSCFVDRAESAARRYDPVWTVLLGRAAAAARRPSHACASRPTRASRVPPGSRQPTIEA